VSDSGAYLLTSEEGCTTVINLTVTGSLSGSPVAIVAATPVFGAFPLDVSFTGSGSTDNIGISSYSWDFGDGEISSIPDPDHTYISAGLYTAVLTVIDTDGLINSSTVNIDVTDSNPPCTGTIVPEYRVDGEWLSGSNDLTVTEGTELMFSMLPNGIGVTIEYPDGTLVGDDYLLGNATVSDSGAYLLTSEEGCTTVINLVVEKILLISQLAKMEETQPLYITNEENILVLESNNMILYPNPVSDILTISFLEEFKIENIQIHDGLGRLLQTVNVENRVPIQINLSQYNSGVYFIVANSLTGESIQKKVLVKRK
ncbi:MAG: PKD domain-containing protein, partial [Maribacter arcticus]|uniref:T9SS type A sorting domain-containing protein n=1 Tax=Maribacter arcticus TaxID=561365 RepID=UPI0030016A26